MDPLEAPLPGLLQQTTENQPWLDELEEGFFTVPPVERDVEPDEVEVTWKGRSPWPARLFVGACVAVVAASTLLLVPLDLFGPDAVRYPLQEVIVDLETGPAVEPVRTAERVRRARRTPKVSKKLSATRPWTLPPAAAVAKPVPGPVEPSAAPKQVEAPKQPVETTPMRVDALPAADLSRLEPGAAL